VLVAPHALPKTTSGKLRRAACRDAYASGELARAEPSAKLQLMRLFGSALLRQVTRAWQRISTWLLSAWGWFCLALLAPITWSLVLLARSLPARWRVVHAAARTLFALTRTPVRVEGERAQLERAGVLVANHSSYLDVLAIAAALATPVRFVAKAELRNSRLLRLALDRLAVHYVERSELAASLSDALRARQLASAGAPPLLFFPEGTFTRAPGLRAFHMGAFDTTAQCGLTLVPLLLDGTRSILRDGSWLLRRGAIDVRIGPALSARSRGFDGALELRDAARAWMVTHGSEPDLGQ
jgi:1-acyl-sn-glycerol-3-phosphate acyltransferase